ncbi:MAG: phosphoribosyltransferase family protein [Ferruginibacter sp.]
MRSLKNFFSDAIHFFYPHICTGCGSDLLGKQELLCLKCLAHLPHTQFEKYVDNPIEKIFTGRFPLKAGSSEFYFSKSQVIQQLIHQLKYKGNKEIGFYLGAMMGKNILASPRFSTFDFLIPLPLYADKEFKRGYNQAEIICNGMSSVMQIPVLTKNIIRHRSTQTQTHKHRTERWENVVGSFAVNNAAALINKNILLVDDVITTGATLEACCQTLLQVPGITVSVATLAIASK